MKFKEKVELMYSVSDEKVPCLMELLEVPDDFINNAYELKEAYLVEFNLNKVKE